MITISGLFILLTSKKNNFVLKFPALIVISVILLQPLFQHFGCNFKGWDAVVSWNRWALELYLDDYNPYKAAYPVFMPALWSLVYKNQGTDMIWWTAQATIFVFPTYILAVILALYNETKEISLVLTGFFLYPYLIWQQTVCGLVDMPVALVGFWSLLMLYAAETIEGQFNLYLASAILLAGIASIIKQAGIFFLFFCILFLLLNIRKIKRRKIILVATILSFTLPGSYLILFLHLKNNPIENLAYLEKISYLNNIKNSDILSGLKNYTNKYFSYPPGTLNRYTAVFMIVISYPLYIVNRNLRSRPLLLLASIGYGIGVFAWAKYFSYDARNSYWTKMVLIIFTSVILSTLIGKFLPQIRFRKLSLQHPFHSPKGNRFIAIIAVMFFTVSPILLSLKYNDNFAFTMQKQTQSKIGNPEVAKEICKILTDTAECVTLYTNCQTVVFNYYTSPVRHKIKFAGWDVGRLLNNFLVHKCHSGRYILLGEWDRKNKPKEWKRLLQLEKSGRIKKVSNISYLYFIPPSSNKL